MDNPFCIGSFRSRVAYKPSCTVVAVLSCVVLTHFASAQNPWVNWNGIDYLAVPTPEGITWSQARLAALAMGGDLASPTSASENDFVFSLVDSPAYWRTFRPGFLAGTWLGGYQPNSQCEPACNWQWVSGEPWAFTAWAFGEPNNLQDEGRVEDRLIMWSTGGQRSSRWNDWSNFAPYLGGSYVVEVACIGVTTPTPIDTCYTPEIRLSAYGAGVPPLQHRWQVLSLGPVETWIDLDDGPLVIDGVAWGSIYGSFSETIVIHPDAAGYATRPMIQLRCTVSNACGSLSSGTVAVNIRLSGEGDCNCAPCPADYDTNGGVDGGDLAAFFDEFQAGESCADVDLNGGIDGGDLAYFFQVFEAGGC